MSKEQKEGVNIWELIDELNNANKEFQNSKASWVWKNPNFTEQLNSLLSDQFLFKKLGLMRQNSVRVDILRFT